MEQDEGTQLLRRLPEGVGEFTANEILGVARNALRVARCAWLAAVAAIRSSIPERTNRP